MTTQIAPQLTPQAALADLGVSADLLTDDERRQLDENGFVVLDGVLDEETVARVRERLDAVLAAEREAAQTDDGVRRQARKLLDHSEKNLAALETMELSPGEQKQLAEAITTMRASTDRLRELLDADDVAAIRALPESERTLRREDFILDLVETDPVFDLPLSTPRVLAAITHVLGPEIHSWGILCRTPKVGEGHQGLHRDPGEQNHLCNSLWLIDDMGPANGATRLVPGSHLSERGPADELDDPEERHPREVVVEGKAGQVVVFNGRAWHSGTQRTANAPRRLLIGPYSVRSMFRDQPLHVPPAVATQLSPAQRWLLDLDDEQLAPGERAYARGAG
jgi:ectoine hydroxylase-related dioxygenase (phytanoyl-CoA dioxygenase family)